MAGTNETVGVTLRAENIGGISETSVTLSPGVTVLVGRNATNRTSFLQAVMAACGSTRVSIKADADEGRVEMELGEETYTHRLERRNGSLVTDGTPYLTDPTVADLFAFLLASNETRRTVVRGGDLRDLIMRPVDTAEIEDNIDRLLRRRRQLDEELAEIESLKDALPDLERERAALREEIEAKRAQRERKQDDLESANEALEQTWEQKSELERKIGELSTKRSELDEVRYDIETKQETLDTLREEKHSLEAERDRLPEPEPADSAAIDERIESLREQKRTLETDVSDLQATVRFNEGVLDGNNDSVLSVLGDDQDRGAGALTDQLLDDGTITCWTCQSTVDRAQIESTVQTLRDVVADKQSQLNEVAEELDELKARRGSLRETRRKRERIEGELADLSRQTDETNAAIEALQGRREALLEEIERAEREIESLEGDTPDEVLRLQAETNEIEYELGKLESELTDVEAEIDHIESRIGESSELEAERDRTQAEIVDERARIQQIENSAVEAFNEHMETMLDLLDYDNLERLWIERTEQDEDGNADIPATSFQLHVVRTTESGTAYEDTIDHLSESEREVTGLVFALAGYLAHDVHENPPFMLLDSLEAIDAERISRLVEYLARYSDYLVVALLPEDAEELADSYDRVTDI